MLYHWWIILDNRLYLIDLYDYYGELLTEKQKDYFEDYYFNNLTLLEISENYSVSRNAIHKQLKETEEKLKNYESCLELYKKKKRIKELIDLIDDSKIKEQILDLL